MELPRVSWRAATVGGAVVIMGGGWWWWLRSRDDRTGLGILTGDLKDQGDGAAVPPDVISAVLPEIDEIFPG